MTDQLHIQGLPPISLSASRYVLGREAGCDVLLTTANGTVSRQHAALERDAQNQWSIIDLNSTNGVYVNDRRIAGSRVLLDGDRIGIGDNQLTLLAPRAAPQNQTMLASSPPVPQSAHPPAAAAPQRAYCQKCGEPNALAAAFCSGCGNSLNAQGGFGYSGSAPPQQNQNVHVNVVNKNSNSGWWAAVALMLFGTPIGCIAIPAFFIFLFVIFATGITFLPMVIAIVAAVIVWKYEGIDSGQKTTIVACILGGGFIVQLLIFASLSR